LKEEVIFLNISVYQAWPIFAIAFRPKELVLVIHPELERLAADSIERVEHAE